MTNAGVFLLAGLGVGAVYAVLGLGLVFTYKGTGVINFAAGVMGAWSAYVYSELTSTGRLVLPVIGIPGAIHIGSPLGAVPATIIAGLYGVVLGLIIHVLVFRPLRHAPVLAKVVASVGVMLAIQSLVVERFGANPRVINPILASSSMRVAGIGLPEQTFWLAGIVVVVSLAMGLWFKYARTGLAMRAAAENELTTSLARFSPDSLAALSWAVASGVVGFLIVLAVPITGLNDESFTLYIVPALACALVGRLTFIGPTVLAGFLLGMINSEVTYLDTKPWWPTSLGSSTFYAVPFIAIVVVLFFAGKSLPSRDTTVTDRLPRVPRPRWRPRVVAVLVGAGALLLTVTGGQYRFGLITTMIMATIALSIVLLTGLLGQVSLAQAAFAGIGGFAVSKLSISAGIGFPWAPLIAAVIAALAGLIAGLPALRIRGAQLAVVTISMALACEQVLFNNQALNGVSGNPVPAPRLPGLNLSIRGGQNIARLPFALMCLVVLTLTCMAVANLTRSGTGRRFLAVRSNERASASIGVSVTSTKLIGFTMSAFLAGLGGTLLAYSHGSVSVDSFTTLVGVAWLVYAYLGGITSVGGALTAALFVTLGIVYVIVGRFVSSSNNAYLLISALGLIVTVIFNPEGISGALRRQLQALKRQRRGPAAEEADTQHAGTRVHQAKAAAALVDDLGSARANSVLEVTNLHVAYGGVVAVRDVSVRAESGKIVGLIGANGAGKTTIIDAISGFTAYRGSITLGGARLDGIPPHRRTEKGLARTWQSSELFADLTVLENVKVACETGGVTSALFDCVHPGRNRSDDRSRQCLAAVGLAEASDRFPSELSLGQQKLLNVARALGRNPQFLLLDEPAAGLSTGDTRDLGQFIRDMVEANRIGILLVEHDVGLVTRICDYIYVIDFGVLIAEGTPEEIRSNPAVIKAYLGSGFETKTTSRSAGEPSGVIESVRSKVAR
jgi:ABC-type branched-subunit amino acid transport system ATPase component/ABC-type branched-subunit amino acid transport system permease subunit